MAKSLDDLDDTPLSNEPVYSREVQAFIANLETLLEDPAFDYAAPTLDGILKTVKRTGKVTEGQSTAVHNIYNGTMARQDNERRDQRRFRRRYEGWGGSR